ncbi:DUF5937 family protein [Streptomyces sviceus]|uniref:DUF5937 family protein n=1 Tax=Streptomyces sviceus TaxID=285530 RepID=UPI0036ED34EB
MSVRIDIAGLRPERVAVVPSPLAELGMALHALAEPGHHPGLQAWVTGATARLDPHPAGIWPAAPTRPASWPRCTA